MPDLRELYQEVILDHNRRPRNYHEIADATRKSEGFNPLCGDRLTLYVRLDGDVIREASFVGSGCAISKASASLLTEAVKGRSLAEAKAMFERFHHMVTSHRTSPRTSRISASSPCSPACASFPCASSARASRGTR